MSSGYRKQRRVLSPEERALWTTVAKTIAPLREFSVADEDDRAGTATPVRPAGSATNFARSAHAFSEKNPPRIAPLGRRMKQRLGRGKEPIDGSLELHGLTQSKAHAALLQFLRSASARGARLVLVITGKGARAGEGERGVLKRKVPQWLGLPEFRVLVIGFEDAHLAHGGEGALYIRIRRTRGG